MKKLSAENEDLVKSIRMLRAHYEVARNVEAEIVLEYRSREEENIRALDQAQEEVQCHKDALENSIDECRRLQELLHARTSQLNVAQSFMSQTDVTSAAEVTRMVKALNHDILQVAAAFADAPKVRRSGRVYTRNSHDLLTSQRMIGKYLTDALTKFKPFTLKDVLSKPEPEFSLDPDSLIQISVQACMIRCCDLIVKSWDPSNIDDQLLRRIYSNLSHRAGKL